MAKPSRDAALAAFKQTFRQLAPYRHRYEVFWDFVTMAACSLHNGIHKDEAREEEYLRIIGQYKPEDQRAFPKLMVQLVAALDEEPRDILGPLYMELEIANKDAGQYFTPPELSELMAQITFAQELDKLETQAAEARSRQAAREAMTNQLGRVSTAFQVGAYTFTGVMIFDALSGYGYALSETTHENEQVADEIATAVAEGEAVYHEKFCANPSNRERYVVPSWTVSCGDGSAPVNGQGVALAELRQKAAG